MTKLTAQQPAEGILKRNDWGDTKAYTIACSCGDNSHDHNLWVEADTAGITVTIYTRLQSKWWSMNRFRTIWTLLTKGHVEYECTTIMTDQQVITYAGALTSAVDDVAKFKAAACSPP